MLSVRETATVHLEILQIRVLLLTLREVIPEIILYRHEHKLYQTQEVVRTIRLQLRLSHNQEATVSQEVPLREVPLREVSASQEVLHQEVTVLLAQADTQAQEVPVLPEAEVAVPVADDK